MDCSIDMEMYASLIGINMRRWNMYFDQDMRTWFKKEKSSLQRKAKEYRN